MVTAEDSPQSFTPSRPTGHGPRLNEKSNSLPKIREQNYTCSGMHGGVEMVVHPGPDPRTRTKPSPARLTTDRLRPLHPTRLRQPTAGVQKDRPAIPSNHRSALIRQCSFVSAHEASRLPHVMIDSLQAPSILSSLRSRVKLGLRSGSLQVIMVNVSTTPLKSSLIHNNEVPKRDLLCWPLST